MSLTMRACWTATSNSDGVIGGRVGSAVAVEETATEPAATRATAAAGTAQRVQGRVVKMLMSPWCAMGAESSLRGCASEWVGSVAA